MAIEAQVIDLLVRVRARLTNPLAWHQNDFAATLAGVKCEPWDRDARCWCLVGACSAETTLAHFGDAQTALVALGIATAALMDTVGIRESGLTLEGWNDAPGRTHSDVLGVLDLTIARLARQQGAAA